MQIWGPGPFDNNQAMALCNAMADHPDPIELLRATLRLEAGGAKAQCRIVAAAHLLALDLGFGEATPPGEDGPPLWAIARQDAESARPLAVQALGKVLDPGSDLRRWWEGRDPQGQAWLSAVTRLCLHLEAPGTTPPPPRPFWE
jgi:hypothetical protein